MKKKTLT